MQISKHQVVISRPVSPMASPDHESRIESDSESRRSLHDTDDIPAQMEILISSKSALQLTVTKTSLGVLKELMNTYMEDVTLLTEMRMEVDAMAPEMHKPVFFLKNEVRLYVLIIKCERMYVCILWLLLKYCTNFALFHSLVKVPQ